MFGHKTVEKRKQPRFGVPPGRYTETLQISVLALHAVRFLASADRKAAEQMKKPTMTLLCLLTLPVIAPAQNASPGHVNFMPNANSSWDHYFTAPSNSLEQFMLGHFAN